MNTDKIPHLTKKQYGQLLNALYCNPTLVISTVRLDAGLTEAAPTGMTAIGWKYYLPNVEDAVYDDDHKEIIFVKGN